MGTLASKIKDSAETCDIAGGLCWRAMDEGPDLATVAELFEGELAIEARLPWNGLSLVFRGTRDGEPMAVALLPVECESPERAARFEELVRRTEQIAHPRIVTVRGHGVRHGVPWVEMDYAEGKTLAEELARGPVPPERAGAIAGQILDALGHAHALGVLHCDLTPANVLIDRGPDGRDAVRVLGFGLAQVIRRARGTDVTGPTGKGSGEAAIRYLPPELLAGEPPSARSDLYSVGALLHHMLVGQPPSSKSPPPPDHARAVLSFAMARSPNDRFEGASQMAHAIGEWIERLSREVSIDEVLAEPEPERALTPWPEPKAPSIPPVAPPERVAAVQLAVPGSTPSPPRTLSDTPVARGRSVAPPARTSPRRVSTSIYLALGLLVGAAATAVVILSQQGDERVVTPPTRTAPPPPEPEEPEPAPPAGPLDRDVPEELAALIRRIDESRPLDRTELAPVQQWARANRDDARSYLVLGRAFTKMGWNSDAIERYERAYALDPSAKSDTRMLDDLLTIATRPETGDRAGALVRRVWGADAIPVVDARLEGEELRRDERERLTRLRERLARTGGP